MVLLPWTGLRRSYATIDLVDVMPLASSLQGQAFEDERDYRPHQVFVHRRSNEAVCDCNG